MRSTTRLGWLAILVLAGALLACSGGSNGDKDTGSDTPADADAQPSDTGHDLDLAGDVADTDTPDPGVDTDDPACPGTTCPSVGERGCTNGGYRVCEDPDHDGCPTWSVTVPCGTGEACVDGECVPACQNECTIVDDARCADGDRVTCRDDDDDGCLEWTPDPCEQGTACDAGQCVTQCVDDCPLKGLLACTDGNAVHRCGDYDDDDCLDWSAAEACTDGKQCVDGACKIPCDDECPEAGDTQCRCADPLAATCDKMTSLRTCGQHDADDCLEWGEATPCGPDYKCVDGVCKLDVVCAGECSSAADCDDLDLCTADTCNTLTCTCSHAQISCDDGDICTNDFCKKALGCVNLAMPETTCCKRPCASALECNDQDACTTDTCSGAGCCQAVPVDCDDGDACTLDTCLPLSGCKHTAISGCPTCTSDQQCDDKNLCTTDKCTLQTDGKKTCTHSLKTCDDGDGCTDDRCVPETGLCQFAVPDTDGGTCEPIDCDGAAFLCDDGQYCTTDLCSPAGDACWHYLITCENAGDPCSLGHCDEGLQMCVYDAVTPEDCDDGNGCTVDACLTFQGGCVHTPRVCDDDKCCTIDACDVTSGQCVFSVNTCDDHDACTKDWCDEDKCGCQHEPTDLAIACAANGAIDPCTVWSCDPATAYCVSAPRDCDDGSSCTKDSCETGTGRCVHKRNTCNDFNPCTVEQCDDETAGCYWDDSGCDDRDPCTDDACSFVDGGCSFTAHACDDGKAGTTDSCDPRVGCLHAVLTACATNADCSDANKCTTDTCQDDQVCAYAVKSCDDGNACTVDTCDAVTGTCVHEARNCSDGVFCSRDVCDPVSGQCEHQADLNCDDGNACTEDSCNEQYDYCIHTDITCADTDVCTDDTCDPATGCVFPQKCDDGDPCSYDNCEPGTGECYFVKIPGCGACTLDGDCSDTKMCTDDVCGSAGVCLHSAASCDDTNYCTYDWCQEGTGCVHQPKANCTPCTDAASCSDGDACTSDVCNPDGSCTHATLDCNDGEPCTTDFCTLSAGCVHQKRLDGLECLIPAGGAGVCCKGTCQSAGIPCQ